MLKLLNRWKNGSPVVIFHEFKKPPYGGGNQFLLALKAEMQRQGIDVGVNRVGSATEVVLFNSYNFDYGRLCHIDRTRVRMIHRVDGPIGTYRGKNEGVDRKIWQMNTELAHATIFQSQYSLEMHRELGLEFRNPTVIPNAVDARIFRRAPNRLVHSKIRLIASAWSDNPKKGAPVYQWLDEHLDRSRFEFTFVGRIKAQFKNSRHIQAVPSEELGDLLRDHDIYIAASEDDPCSNALIEALACGLPVLYRNSGGHPELVKGGGLGFSKPAEIPSLLDELASSYDRYRSNIQLKSIAEVTTEYLNILARS